MDLPRIYVHIYGKTGSKNVLENVRPTLDTLDFGAAGFFIVYGLMTRSVVAVEILPETKEGYLRYK